MAQKENELFWRYHVIDRKLQMRIKNEMNRLGYKKMGAPYILAALNRLGDCGQADTQKEIAEVLQISPASVTMSIKLMNKSGLLTKTVDENDQRANLIMITDKGRDVVEKYEKLLDATCSELYKGFSDEEKEILLNFSQRIQQNLEQMGILKQEETDID